MLRASLWARTKIVPTSFSHRCRLRSPVRLRVLFLPVRSFWLREFFSPSCLV